MIDPCEVCSVPVADIWFDRRCSHCVFNETNWKRDPVNPCIPCVVPNDLRCSGEYCSECPVMFSPDDIFATDLSQMSFDDYLAYMAKKEMEEKL